MATNFVTTAQLDKLVALYVGYFNRAPEADGLNYWSQTLLDGLNAGKTEAAVFTEIANSFYDAGLQFGTFSAAQTVEDFIKLGYANALGRSEVDAAGMQYWRAKLVSGEVSRGEFIQELIEDAYAFKGDATWGWVATYMTNRVAVGNYFADNSVGMTDEAAIVAGTNALKVVTPATAQAGQTAEQAIATLTAVAPVTLNLTVGQDNLVGTLGDDTFVAGVVQNAAGEQTNQLATGDKITGGAGVDTLEATVQKASALNGSPTQAITPKTTGVEKALFTALTVDNTSATGAAETVVINAKNMNGLTLVGSVQSDASLTIENLTTLKDDGVYADRRTTDKVTIRMDHSGNDVAVDAASDLTVLFDNDYLVSGSKSTDSTLFWLEDRKGAANDPTQPLNAINVDGVRINVDGVEKKIVIDVEKMKAFLSDNVLGNVDVANPGTWQGFVALLQEAITELAKTDAAVAAANITVALDASQSRTVGLDGTTLPLPAPAMVFTSNTGKDLSSIGFHAYEGATGSYDVFGDKQDGSLVTVEDPVVATIELEKVGRGAEGGDLTVGGMATDLQNVFEYSESAIKEGVDRFNITVSGDQTQFSSLASLQSTNNTLKTVNVVWAADSVADLIIGNHNTGGALANGITGSDDDLSSVANNALKDVRDFTVANNNTTTVNGKTVTTDVTVYAKVTDESVAKYMNLADNAANPASDDANFVYSFGSGNDLLNINLSKANLAESGTTNRADFSFTANMGDGNDTIEAQIGDGKGVASDAWFINSQLDDNLEINAGAGNDTVRTFGAGNWDVNLGAGNDVIYSDNSGNQNNVAVDEDGVATDLNYNSGRAVWVLNTADQVSATVAAAAERDIDDLVSDGNGDHALYNGKLTVDFNGVQATIDITDYNTTDLELNNLIKAAIQSDVYLSKLIVAEDGPANTLVIRSLVDGAKDALDLTVFVSAGTISTMSAAQIADFNTANATKFTTTAEIAAFVGTEISAFNTGTDYDTALANDGVSNLTGAASTAVATSTIVDGTGTDTIVLSTSGIGSETVNLVDDAQKDVIFNIQHATINGVHAEDLLVTAEGVSYTFAQLKAAGLGTLSADGKTIDNIAFDNGIPGGGGVVYNPIVLVPGTTAPATAPIVGTAAADLFSLDVVTAASLTANTQINVSGFVTTGTVADKLQIDLAVALPSVTTLAQLDAASTEITAFYNAIDNLIDITFGPDANGDVISLTLLGVSDASQVAVAVI